MSLSQTIRIDGGGRLDPLLSGDRGPLLLAGETGGQRFAAVAIRPDASGMLPLMASWPIFIGNLVYWGLGDEVGRDIAVNRTGEVLTSDTQSIQWQDNPNATIVTSDVTDGVIELANTGLWKIDNERFGTANLASRQNLCCQACLLLATQLRLPLWK